MKFDDKWSHYAYPFSELRFESHVHPKFIIFNVGSKMRGWGDELTLKLCEDLPSLGIIWNLYYAWTRDIPQRAKDDKSYYMVPVEHDNDTDDTPNPDNGDYKGPKSLRTNYGRNGYWSTEITNVARRNPVR